MKSYVITIKSIPDSVAMALRCIDSLSEFDVQMFTAMTPEGRPEEVAKEKGINTQHFNNKYSRFLPCLSAFLSHHSLWEMCVETGEEIQIFEHDAICVGNLPKFIPHQGCLSLGHPSYGRYKTPSTFGVNKLVSKEYFPGAHAYRVKPLAAETLINVAKTHAQPTDVFLNNQNFSFLEEYYPWPVKVRETFSTIQSTTGCLAKHGYNEETYRLL